ncbi:MAG: T9SS type A sorting domain-containing protein [Saprospiraceae bacterium]|nr:T9SS type A sorting domain-containing protein [Saprospiraceae bacterium]
MSRILTQWSHPFRHLSRPCVVILALCLAFSMQAREAPVFHIECPPDVTINCDDEIGDLSIYGTATIYGYGSPQPAGPPESEVYNLNSCGTGTIVRTWVAYDYAGTAYSCSQIIYVGGSGYANITWPLDYIINTCDPDPPVSPNELPPPYDRPVVNTYGSSCGSQIMMNYDDMVFEINPPACIKILRKWTVIDWCLYDPNAYYPQGIWEHTQLIKIKPENPPVIYCFSDTTVSAGADCTGGHVDLPLVTGASDCGAGVTITNHSPYAYSNGADASGFYPLGTTKVVFTADDGCGGKTTCSVYITVTDMKKPTPICYYGISVSLMAMPDGYYMDLQPHFFDKGSFDNCTPREHLTFEMVPSRVTCADLGETPVQMYVTDQAGNSQYCNTVVRVQDNMDMCPPSDGIIGGVVHSASGVMMDDVEVTIQEMDQHVMTDPNGSYTFDVVPFGHAYTVKPELANNDMTGITTLDLVILLKHILGVETLNDPYLHVAADLDGSGWISVNDLLMLKDLILRNHFNEPAATSWKFVDASFDFDTVNPLSQPVPESYLIDQLTSDMTGLDFVGIKLGDLSGDATDDDLATIETRSRPILDIMAAATSAKVDAGEEFEITLTSSDIANVFAYQFSVSVEDQLAEILAIRPGDLPGMELSNFGIGQLDQGTFTTAWFDLETAGTDHARLVTVSLRAKEALRTSEVLEVVGDPTPAMAYNAQYEQMDLQLHFTTSGTGPGGNDVPSGLIIGSNYPNPFSTTTLIPVQLDQAEELLIEVFDTGGRNVFQSTWQGVAGVQDIALDAREIGARGMLLCRISSAQQTATTRIVIMDDH